MSESPDDPDGKDRSRMDEVIDEMMYDRYDPSEDSLQELSGDGTALGVVEDLDFHESIRRDWRTGNVLVIGTDGIWDARNPKGEMFGQKRFLDTIRKHADASAAGIQKAVLDAVEAFQGDATQEDDITLVVVKLL